MNWIWIYSNRNPTKVLQFPSEYADLLLTLTFLCEKTNMLHEIQTRPLHQSENLILTIYHRLRIGLRLYYWQYPAGRMYMQNWVISTALASDYVDKYDNLNWILEYRSFPKSHIWNDFNIVAYLINYCSCPTNHLSETHAGYLVLGLQNLWRLQILLVWK